MDRISLILRESDFERFGFSRLAKPFSIELYESWLAKGFQGEMGYLERHLEEKRDPNLLAPRARSAIVVTENYVPHPSPTADWPLRNGAEIAAYARGKDYHRFLNSKLKQTAEKLRLEFPGEEFLVFTDSSPVLERDLARRAGLGWVGKNTMLIDREIGSMFLIGEIYTSLEFPIAGYDETELSRDFCGTCTRCLDACPTGAIVAPKEVDARKCISYLTIEMPHIAPEPLRSQIGGWLFGCDVCQTVCPWNIKAFGEKTLDQLHPKETNRDALISDLRYLLTSSNRHLERIFRVTPLKRINGMGMKRNALVVAGNLKLTELVSDIEEFKTHPRLGELAAWALEKILATA